MGELDDRIPAAKLQVQRMRSRSRAYPRNRPRGGVASAAVLELHVLGIPGSEGGGLRLGESPEIVGMVSSESRREAAAEVRRGRPEMHEKRVFAAADELVFAA